MTELEKRIMEGDVFDCAICLDTLNNPKYLPCLHNFCEKCLHTYINDSGTEIPGSPSSYFKCPICRAMVIPPDPRSSIKTWAGQMPGNNLIVALLEDAALGDEHFCDPCKKGDETITAGVWCQDCSEFLCDACQINHARTRGTNKHKVVSAEVVKSTATKGVEVPEPCMIHDGRNLEVYCLKHKKMACIICLADEHRHCQHIRPLETMAAHMNATGGAASLTKQITSIIQKADSFVSYKELYINTLDDKHKEMHSNMEKLVEKAKQRLDFLHEQFKHELDDSQDMIKSKLNLKKDRIIRFKKTLENSSKLLQLVGKRGSPKQLFIQTDKVKKQIARQLDQIQEYFGDEDEIEFSVKISEDFDDFSTNLSSLGTVNVVFKSKDDNASKSRRGSQTEQNGSLNGNSNNRGNNDMSNYMAFRGQSGKIGGRGPVSGAGAGSGQTGFANVGGTEQASLNPGYNGSRTGSRTGGGSGQGSVPAPGVNIGNFSPGQNQGTPQQAQQPGIVMEGYSQGQGTPQQAQQPGIVMEGYSQGQGTPQQAQQPGIVMGGYTQGQGIPQQAQQPGIVMGGYTQGQGTQQAQPQQSGIVMGDYSQAQGMQQGLPPGVAIGNYAQTQGMQQFQAGQPMGAFQGVNGPMDAVPEMYEDDFNTDTLDHLLSNSSVLDINMEAISEEQHLMKLKEIDSMGEGGEINSWFTGGAFLDDGRIILADHNNSCFKIYDSFAAIESTHKMEHTPWDIATGHGSDLFATFCKRKYIKKFRIKENTLEPFGYVRTTKGNWGIDVCQNFIVTGREGSIDILNYQGRLLRSILRGGLNVYVCGSPNDKYIYYTDCDDIICRQIFAKSEKFRYRSDDIKGARGIAVDKSDDIYVCGIYSHNVVKVSSDGSKSMVIIPDLETIREPFALGMDKVGEKVFATSYNESTAVTFFQMSKSWSL